jgi:hypothetical protein
VRTAAAAVLALSVFVAASCGGAAPSRLDGSDRRTLSGLGISVELPPGWIGRIRPSREGLPALQAASFPLPANDSEDGQVAQESIGTSGTYVNLLDLGPHSEDADWRPVSGPVIVERSSLGAPKPPQHYAPVVLATTRNLLIDGRARRLTVFIGFADVENGSLAEVNALLHSMSLSAPPEPSDMAGPEPGGNAVSGYGIRMRLPPGWNGSVTRGVLQAASFPLSPGDAPDTARSDMGSEDALITLFEHDPSEAPFVTSGFPVVVDAPEFVPPEPGTAVQTSLGRARGALTHGITGRSFVAKGREFVLWVESGTRPPARSTLEALNQALATLQIEPGDFYPGTVEPATFVSAPDWYTGTNGPGEAHPDGEQTRSWASTVPVLDEPFGFAQRTLESIPDHGIVIVVQLSRTSVAPPTAPDHNFPVLRPPYRLSQAHVSDSWEGQVRDLPEYAILSRVPRGQGQYNADIRVFFGRPHPTAEQLERAQAELDRLRLPDWGGWELEEH